MMGRSPRCYIPSFVKIGSPVLEKKIFEGFLLHGGHLGHVTWTIYINFRSPFPRRLHIKFGFDWPSGFRGEDVWKCEGTDGRRRRTDGRRIHGYPISSPVSLQLRWAKNMSRNLHMKIWAASQKNLSLGFPTKSDTNPAIQPQKMARGLKIRI